jgi:hypothetical protein
MPKKNEETTVYAARINAASLPEKDFCLRASEFKGQVIALVDSEDKVITTCNVPNVPFDPTTKSYSGTLRGAHNRAMVAAGLRNKPGEGTGKGTGGGGSKRGAKYGLVEIVNDNLAQFYGKDVDADKYIPCGTMLIGDNGILFSKQAIQSGYATKVLGGHLGQMIELSADGKPVGKSDEFSSDGGTTWYPTKDEAIESVTDMNALKAFLTGKAEIQVRSVNRDGKLSAFVKHAEENGIDEPVK